MAGENMLWGAERIRGELLKLGLQVSKRTIQKYMRMVRPSGMSERQLRRILTEYVETYFNTARPHQGLSQRVPAFTKSPPALNAADNVIAFPILGGLHHDYRWAVAE